MTRRLSQQGVTLIEIMVAMTIVAMLAIMMWGAFAQTVHNKDRVEHVTDRYHAIRMAIERMQRELSMSFVSIHTNADGNLAGLVTAFIGKNRGDSDRLDFTSFSHRRLFRDAKESDENELGYFLARDPSNPSQKVLARREQNRIDAEPQEGGRTEVLLTDVRALNFEYLDPQSGQWLDTWDTTQAAGQPNRLPTQIKILITVADIDHPGKDRVFGTRATLPITWALNHSAYNP